MNTNDVIMNVVCNDNTNANDNVIGECDMNMYNGKRYYKVFGNAKRNDMSLDYLWSILQEEAYYNNGEYEQQHYTAIINLIEDMPSEVTTSVVPF